MTGAGTGADLFEEANSANANIRPDHFEHLISLGVAVGTISRMSADTPFPCAARIRSLPGGLYELDPEGEWAMLIPVAVPDTFEVWGAEFDKVTIIDLIAFRTSRPTEWRWRTGAAWALGDWLLDGHDGEPIELVDTPLAWLRAGGNAVCILDWSITSPAWSTLRSGPPLIVANELIEARLVKSMRLAAPLPQIRRVRNAA